MKKQINLFRKKTELLHLETIKSRENKNKTK
jgi:hypothetical protein